MTFYENLSQLCEEHGITISGLLSELNMSASNKQKWQNGATVNSMVLAKIADYFQVPTDYLLGRTENNSFNMGDMSNVNNNVMGNNNNVQQQPQENKDYGRYNELTDYLDDLPIRERRRAIVSVLEFLEDNFPKKKEI